MGKIAAALILVLVLMSLAFVGLGINGLVSANPDSSFPNLAMPIEYVNYTISPINGTLWATVDGDYPIYLLNQSNCAFTGDLPMVYPMPPNTANIHVFLADKELSWTNYSQTNPDFLHHTAIGDWWMIYSVVGTVSNYFELKIHYQHPLQMVNGSYIFLYDLNISPYLSSQYNSTVIYTIRIQTNTTNLHAYTTATDTQWNPINYTTTNEGSTKLVTIEEHSELNSIPGDLVVMFSEPNALPEFQLWALSAIIISVVLLTAVFKRRRIVLFSSV
jgi:hypothetical protein